MEVLELGPLELQFERPDPEVGGGFARAMFGQIDSGRFALTAEEWAQLSALLPRLQFDEGHQVPIGFWSLTPTGPRIRMRQIDVPDWVSIEANYGRRTFGELAELMSEDFVPGAGGQLVLWHGPPGTGKTFALRALAWEWRKWCSVHCITDPESFFGDSAAYMLDVLLHDDEETKLVEGEPVPPRERWRLLVLEDSGELLTADAKERTGQGLSRLLNVCDGLIGQGLRLLVLVTTNEKISALHEAVARPGRCAAKVEFDKLSSDEAADWLELHDAREGSTSAATVADLYARLAGSRNREQRQTVGFVR